VIVSCTRNGTVERRNERAAVIPMCAATYLSLATFARGVGSPQRLVFRRDR
jgi:hypothetical protein